MSLRAMMEPSALVIWLHGLCLWMPLPQKLSEKLLEAVLELSHSATSGLHQAPVNRSQTQSQEPGAAALGEMDAARLSLLPEIASERPR